MINKARARNCVAHPCRLYHLPTLHEELEMALDV